MNKRMLILTIIVLILAFVIIFSEFLGVPLSLVEKVSLLFSGIAIFISVLTFLETQKTTMMPVLVFVQSSERTWQLQNVGKGPAITVTVANRDNKDEWSPILFPPIAAGASLNLDTLEKNTDYAAVYKDINGKVYSSLCIKNVNKFLDKNQFPEWKPFITEWQRREIREGNRRNF